MYFIVLILFFSLMIALLKHRRTRPVVLPVVRFLFDRALPASLFLWMAYASITKLNLSIVGSDSWFAIARTASSLMFLLLAASLFVFRHSTRGRQSTPLEALIAIAGTFAINLVGLETPEPGTPPGLMAVGAGVVVLGWLWSFVSLATLGRCFGIFPEARGLVMRGPYRLVRHPLYLGEIVAALGVILPVLSPVTVSSWLLFTGLQLWRASNEERVLIGAFSEYAAYQARTRRLIPLLW